MKKLLGSLCVFVVLTGCNSALYKKSPEHVEIKDALAIQDANYMARYIMDKDERLKLEAKTHNFEIKHYSSQTADTAGDGSGTT